MRPTPGHILVKVSKCTDNEKILKAEGEMTHRLQGIITKIKN